jgi:hypothetical protein
VHGPRSAWTLGPGLVSVAPREQIAVPAQDRVRTHQQPQRAQHLVRKLVQQCRQERSISRSEPHLLAAELPLQHRDLMPQHEDLEVFVSIAHRQQAEHRKRARYAQVGQSQQHG